MNGFVELPEETDSPPAEFRDCYEPARYDGSKYRLKEGVADYVIERQAELDAAEAEAIAALGAERLAHAHTKQLLHDRIVDGALESALKANGASPVTRAGAHALLRKTWQFKIHDDGKTVTVFDGNADHDLHQAIEFWLHSDAGAAFSTRRPTKSANTLTRIQQITSR